MQADRRDASPPVDLAFLAMAQHRLGQTDQARATLGRLRDLANQPRWSEVTELRDLLHEAGTLVDAPAGETGRY
jgi:hypothetical protein